MLYAPSFVHRSKLEKNQEFKDKSIISSTKKTTLTLNIKVWLNKLPINPNMINIKRTQII